MEVDSREAIVVSVEVAQGQGILANEPITTALLRDRFGVDHTVRIVGGPTPKRAANGASEGYAHLAGYVVPVKGLRVTLDLRAPSQKLPPISIATTWIPNTPPAKWARLPVPFVLALPESRDLGAADSLAELDVAARTWGRPACTSFRATSQSTLQSITPGDDGINGVFFHDNAWPAELVAGALGQTVVHVDTNGNLHDTDVHINSADFRFSSGAAPQEQDLRSVLVHEIGHALGLGHSTDPRATMNASGQGLRWRSLEKDDTDGVCALYPGVGTGTQACDPTCPTSFVCVGGACQRSGERADLCSPCPPGDLGASCEAAGDDARCIDLPNNGGRVCGRPCARDEDCGQGFVCRATTEAGDLQCISTVGCKNGANTCTTDADCKDSSCRGGACTGAPSSSIIVDGGAPSDAMTNDAGSTPITARGGDCECRAALSTSSNANATTPIQWLFAALATAWYRRRRRRA